MDNCSDGLLLLTSMTANERKVGCLLYRFQNKPNRAIPIYPKQWKVSNFLKAGHFTDAGQWLKGCLACTVI